MGMIKAPTALAAPQFWSCPKDVRTARLLVTGLVTQVTYTAPSNPV